VVSFMVDSRKKVGKAARPCNGAEPDKSR
jgi:hypothetical protein